jgi:PAS domain-containing protein
MTDRPSLWQILWDHDPNGLVVVNPDLHVTLVNPSFCALFKVREQEIVGFPLSRVLEDAEEFREVWEKNEPRSGEGKEYPRHDLFLRRLLFPVKEERIIAGIMVDLTSEWKRMKQIDQLKEEAIGEISHVIRNQMKIAQDITQLLGETTAESQIALHRLTSLLKREVI